MEKRIYSESCSGEERVAEIVQMLLDAGADKEVVDMKGRTPLHIAVLYGNVNIVKALYYVGANIKVQVRKALPLCTLLQITDQTTKKTRMRRKRRQTGPL